MEHLSSRIPLRDCFNQSWESFSRIVKCAECKTAKIPKQCQWFVQEPLSFIFSKFYREQQVVFQLLKLKWFSGMKVYFNFLRWLISDFDWFRPFLIFQKHPRRCSIKKPEAFNFIKKETVAQMFSCEFCEIFKNIFFAEKIWVAASVFWIQFHLISPICLRSILLEQSSLTFLVRTINNN